MRFSTFISLTTIAITSLFLFACGGGGGASTPALTASQITADSPVLNGGTSTIDFAFGASYDGKPVTFTVSPASAVLTSPSPVVSGGTASVTVSYPATANVTVTASIPGYTGTKTVQFIPQPDRVVVHVATTRTVNDLAILTFGLQNTMGANCPYTSYTPAPAYTGYTAVNSAFFSPGNDVFQWQILVFGLNITPSAKLLEMTFTPASAGIPYFNVFQYPNNPQDLSFSKYTKVTTDPATDTQTTTNLTTTDFVISTDYYLGTALLATK